MTSMPTAVTPTSTRVSRTARRARKGRTAGSVLDVQAVAHALHRDDAPGLGAELLPEPAEVNVHRTRLDLRGLRVSPGGVEELLAAQHAAVRPDQRAEERELLGGQLHGRARHRDPVPTLVQLQGADPPDRRAVRLPRPSEHRPDARHQLARAERLGPLVVGPPPRAKGPGDLPGL